MQFERPYNDEINIGDLFTKIKEYRKYLFKKWWVILIVAFIMGMTLRFYINWKPEHYISHTDFSVKGTEGESTSTLGSLASTFGFGISTGAEFTNEYFLAIMQSRRLIKETLIQQTEISVKGHEAKEDYLVNHYIAMYPRWAKKKKLKKFRMDHSNIDSLTIYEDSVLNIVYEEIIDHDLTVDYTDDLDLNQLEFSSINRDFSYFFADYLAGAASEFYIKSQISSEVETVSLIQHRADSIRGIMEDKEDMLASYQDRSAFTIKATGLLNQGRLLRDLELLNLEYGEVFAQLELAKFDLRNKTPLISVVDSPKFSTIKEKEQIMLFMIIGFVLGTIFSSIFLIIRKYMKDSMEEAIQKQAYIAELAARENARLLNEHDVNE
jgi:capsule polysaccharide export protein KpsE/RkpR